MLTGRLAATSLLRRGVSLRKSAISARHSRWQNLPGERSWVQGLASRRLVSSMCSPSRDTGTPRGSMHPVAVWSGVQGHSFSFFSSTAEVNGATIASDAHTSSSSFSSSPDAARLLEGDPWVSAWLFGVSAMVFAMVVVGGLTRLTKSGLSMTDWALLGSKAPVCTHARTHASMWM